jgi:DNA-binding transcriptional LysR family regulator
VNVSSFDLNHARALHFLLEEAHVARAAGRLGITPAAASNALRRLRDELDDPLLVRAGRALVRTPLGEQLRAPARELLLAAERIVATGARFDPAAYDGAFDVITSDRVGAAVLDDLDRLLLARAPRAVLRVRLVPPDLVTALHDTPGVAITPLATLDAPLTSEPLFEDTFVCLLRRGHPLLRGPWSVKRFAAAEHVLVTPRATGLGPVDEALAARGLQRRIVRFVSTFAMAPPLVAGSDRITTLPESFARPAAAAHGLVVRKPPLALPTIPTRMAWHPRHERDARHRWLRALVRDATVRRRSP